MAENNEIPEDAEKILFVEDLISYMLQMHQIQYESWRSDRYRDLVYRAFNESVQSAVYFMDRTMEMHLDDIFFFMRNANLVDHETYITYAKGLAKKYFPEGFDADNFLRYCVRLAKLAVFFYNHGVEDAPCLAVLNICDAIREYDMTTGGWDTLNNIAERYASMGQDTKKIGSPKSLGSDEEVPENPAVQNAAVNQGDVNNENSGSNDDFTGVKKSDSEANEKVLSPLKRPPSEKEQINIPKMFSKYNPGSKNISSASEVVPSTSVMSEKKKFSDSNFSNESKLKDEIDSKTSDEVPENRAVQNAAINQGNVNNENSGSNDNFTRVKTSDLEANENVLSPLKRPPSEKEQSNILKMFRKCNPGIKNISSASEMVPSTSVMSEKKKFNDSNFSSESELKDEIDSKTSKVKYSIQSSNSNEQSNLELCEQSRLKDQNISTNSVETSQAWNVKPKHLHFEKYSPSSSDDENRFSNTDTDPSLS